MPSLFLLHSHRSVFFILVLYGALPPRAPAPLETAAAEKLSQSLSLSHFPLCSSLQLPSFLLVQTRTVLPVISNSSSSSGRSSCSVPRWEQCTFVNDTQQKQQLVGHGHRNRQHHPRRRRRHRHRHIAYTSTTNTNQATDISLAHSHSHSLPPHTWS